MNWDKSALIPAAMLLVYGGLMLFSSRAAASDAEVQVNITHNDQLGIDLKQTRIQCLRLSDQQACGTVAKHSHRYQLPQGRYRFTAEGCVAIGHCAKPFWREVHVRSNTFNRVYMPYPLQGGTQ